MTLRSLLPAAAVLALLSGCRISGAPCGPDACNGCCDANGVCQAGGTAAACGASGNACVGCGANEACNAGTCGPVQQVDGGTGDAGMQACASTPVACLDQVLLDMGLKATVNPDGITNVADGAGWISTVNASAGGMNVTRSFVYATFTSEGLAQVPFSDEDSLANAQWDIAFRRYVIRLNGGDSGPSCVGAAIAGSASYDGVTEATATGVADVDGFFDDACAFVDDGSGLPTSPKTAMSGFYAYEGCVKMTGAVYVITLADGRKVKAEVLGYYQSASAQQACQDGTFSPGSPGGFIQLRWAFL